MLTVEMITTAMVVKAVAVVSGSSGAELITKTMINHGDADYFNLFFPSCVLRFFEIL